MYIEEIVQCTQCGTWLEKDVDDFTIWNTNITVCERCYEEEKNKDESGYC